MGIKGIYKEIGAGSRVSLTKLAVEKLEQTGRPLRLAIDISIWQFQAQAARGGSNPAIRTLFYRLLRLLGLSIQPIFVFDGPNKPAFKRNKRSGRGDGVATSMAKRLIRLFGFQVHDAPGEAEAECALLQKSGIVDAVLSEDVDTIMFGCTQTLRNWSSEGTKGSKTPTHVSLYDTEELQRSGTGLDREGMVLVALMSGGDYLPEGIPGAGVKLACEAARAGFGKSLCSLKKSDTSELASWKEWLAFELRHNESGYFRTRHKALSVPESFPNLDVLRYYTHPVVSPTSALDRLRDRLWDGAVDVQGLREFVRETFDWNYRVGAVKFIRVLAPCLLVHTMMAQKTQIGLRAGSAELQPFDESELVVSVTGRRAHFSTDATPELRVSFTPTKIVGYDFEQEPDEVIDYGRDGLALNSDDDFEAPAEVDGSEGTSKNSRRPFDPTRPDLVWIPQSVATLGMPLTVARWEEAQHAKAACQNTKVQRPRREVRNTNAGTMDKFVRVSKNVARDKDTAPALANLPLLGQNASPLDMTGPASTPTLLSSQASQKTRPTRSSKQSKSKSTTRNAPPASRPDARTSNPWTIASSQRNVRVSGTKSTEAPEPITISSSPSTSPDQDRHSPMSRPHECTRDSDCPPPSPLQGRSATRDLSPGEKYGASHRCAGARDHSPSPKSQRKLTRTESLPTKQNSERSPSVRRFARARTVAVEGFLSDLEDDSEPELPPLSDIGRLLGKNPSGNFAASRVAEVATPGRRGQEPEKEKRQATLDSTFNATKRTTRLYIPRKSEPGFFREVEVEVGEATDALTKTKTRAHDVVTAPREVSDKRAAAWRRSDISCIDLTAED
ncbi:hypothetical protein GGR52DRAFT_527685 [Hypoxylon sp. FL1284]|nr:hypothetical protein GGR52DRAFT_527685 [Hypoxylon sp. FL1284]